jgi:hypothetical protein
VERRRQRQMCIRDSKKASISRGFFFVDPAGFEPASKQGIKRVSTCLVI